MCKLTINRHTRFLFSFDKWQRVHHFGDKPRFGLISKIHPPDGIGDGVVTIVYFLRKRTFGKVEDGTTNIEIFIYTIIDVCTHQSFCLNIKKRLAFHRNVDGRSGVEYAFVDDVDAPQGVINRIVNIFAKWHAAGSNPYGALRNVDGIKRNF